MKLTHTQNTKAVKSGMTLIELTVVILVLLSLISILFVGARAWKRGSDRAGCIILAGCPEIASNVEPTGQLGCSRMKC